MPVFWLGLLLAYVFALLLKGTPFVLPPSGRFSAGVALQDLDKFWGMTNVTGFKKFIIDLMSNTVLINCIFTGNWKIFWDSLKHLILLLWQWGRSRLASCPYDPFPACSGPWPRLHTTARARDHRTQGDLQTAMRNALSPSSPSSVSKLVSCCRAGLDRDGFSLPGMGLHVGAILARDYPVFRIL